ncbi:MAG: hypothetical protein K6F37_00165 [Lachnospiraceae bacterium]|nr:hypothetical protein [Lachnospiraceae bacterium]
MGLLGNRIDNRFLQQQNERRNDAKKKNTALDEDEETLMYKPFERAKYINDQPGNLSKSEFDDSKSINKAPNIFDATAVFHVKKEEL